jgi:hypothetical protein
MKSMVMLMLLATMTVAGETRFTTAQPISADRVGVAGTNRSYWSVAGGDDSFLLVWRDDRHAWPQSSVAGWMALRVGADGVALDDVPMFLPIFVKAVARGNHEWIVVGQGTMVRISDAGKLGPVKPGPVLSSEISGAAWTGQALVVLATSYTITSSGSVGKAEAIVFDEELNYAATYLLSNQPSFSLGAAGDGVSSAMLLYQSGDSTGIRAAVFDAAGGLHEDRLIHAINYWQPTGAVVATGAGRYAVAVGDPSPQNRKLEVLTLDTDLRRTYLGPLTGHWFPGTSGTRQRMFWDGTSVALYSLMAEGNRDALAVTRFTPDNQPVLATERLTTWEKNLGFAMGMGGQTTILVKSKDFPDTFTLRFRTFSDASELKSNTPFRTLPVERGAFAQGAAAGVSGTTQSAVTWLERSALDDPYAVYATRVARNGEVLDPQSLRLGESPCIEKKPLIATNGTDFLAVWTSPTENRVAAIRADGTFETKRMALRTPASCTDMVLASNGEDFLLVWLEKKPVIPQWDVLAVRLRSDGTAIDTRPIIIAAEVSTKFTNIPLAVASDGRDYLVAWESSALRVSKEGAVLNRFQPILLGERVQMAWWNGRTYVVWAFPSLLRIGTDGTGGAPLGLIPEPAGLQNAESRGLCDADGCTFSMFTRLEDGSYRASIGRLEDDGTTFTMRQTPVVNFVYPRESQGQQPYGRSFPLDAGRLLIVHRLARPEAPYSGVQRLMITPVGAPRTRAVSH